MLRAVRLATYCVAIGATLGIAASVNVWALAPGEGNVSVDTSAVVELAPAVSEAEALHFLDRFAVALSEGRADALFNVDRMARRVSAGLMRDDAAQEEFLAGVTEAFVKEADEGTGLISQMTQTVRAPGGYVFLRVHSAEGKRRLLFRLAASDGSFDYHDYVLDLNDDGAVRIDDVYVYSKGEMMTKTLRTFVSQLVPSGTIGSSSHLTAEGVRAMQVSEGLQRMSAQMRAQQFSSALETYRSLPEEFQRQKLILLRGISAATRVSLDESLPLMELFRKLYADDPALDMLALDLFFLHEQYDDFLAAVDRIDKRVGGDPYLDKLRATGYLALDKIDLARKAVDRAVAGAPEVDNVHAERIGIVLKQNDFDEVLAELTTLNRDFGYEFPRLEETDAYAEFVKSPQYQKWLEDHPRPKEGPISDEEALAFATRYLDAVAEGHGNDFVSWARICDRALAGLEVDEQLEREFRKRVLDGTIDREDFSAQMAAVIAQGGICTPLNPRTKNEQTWLPIRAITRSDDLLYFDLLLERDPDAEAGNQIRIIDADMAPSGWLASEDGTMDLFTLANRSYGGVAQVIRGNDALVTHMSRLMALEQLVNTQQHQYALRAFSALPVEAQQQKVALYDAGIAARALGNDEWVSGLLAMRRRTYPDEASAWLAVVRYYREHDEAPQALETIDGLDKVIGGDPYLDSWRSFYYRKLGDLDEARAHAEACIAAVPEAVGGYKELRDAAMAQKDYDTVVRMLDHFVEHFDFRPNRLDQIAGFEEFTKSPQYDAWLTKHNVSRVHDPNAPRASMSEDGVSGAAALKFVRYFLAESQKGNGAALFSLERLCDRALEPYTVNEADEFLFRQFATSKSTVIQEYVDLIAEIIRLRGHYEPLRAHVDGGRMWISFRLIWGGENVTYHDMAIERMPDGEFRIIDVKQALPGWSLSETLLMYLIFMLADQPAEQQTGPPVSLEPQRRHLVKLKLLSDLVDRKQHDYAYRMYRALPEDVRRIKLYLVLGLGAALQTSPEAYDEVARDFRRWYPGDPAVEMIAASLYGEKKDYKRSLAAIERLRDTDVGQDPYIDAMRAIRYMKMGKPDEAVAAAKRGVENGPRTTYCHFTLISTLLAKKDFEGLTKALDRCTASFPVNLDRLLSPPAMKPFLASEEYRQWRARADANAGNTAVVDSGEDEPAATITAVTDEAPPVEAAATNDDAAKDEETPRKKPKRPSF